jgi:hypothetical protein
MLAAAAGRHLLLAQPQPVAFTARVRRDDPRRELLEPLLDIRAWHAREVEHALVRRRRLVGLDQQAAAARVGAPGHLPRRIAVAELAQTGPFLVAGAVHGGCVAS